MSYSYSVSGKAEQDHVDVADMIITIAKRGEALLADKEVELRINIAADLPTIHADQQGIRQIISNLVPNAVKFTELAISKHLVEIHGGRIWVESEIGKGSIFYVALPRQSDNIIR